MRVVGSRSFLRHLAIAAVCVLLCMPSIPAAAADAQAVKAVAEKLGRWDADGAWKDAEPLLATSPKDGDILDLATQAAFLRGDYMEAARFARAAVESGDNPQRRGFAALIESTIEVVKNYKQYETPHFLIKLDERQDSVLLDYLTDTLERTYRLVADQFGFAPPEKVRVELFADTRGFYYASTLTARDIEVSGAVGLTQFNKLLFLSPRALVHGYRWLDAISHEYMHYMITKMSANHAPIWFHEGLAEHEESRWRGAEPHLSASHETLLAQALASDNFISFARMDPGLVKLSTPEEVQLAYAEAASSIEFIVSKKGYDGLKGLMTTMALAPEKGSEEAVKKVLDLTMADFDGNWKEFLRSKGLKAAEGVTIHRFKVREGLTDDDRMEMREIKSMVARNRAHLGDLLKEKGRPEAAVLEYRRALADAQDSVPVLNRLSETLISLGRDEEALEHLAKAHRLAPDHPVTYANLGQVHLKRKDWVRAETDFQNVIQINPFVAATHRDLATAYEMQGKKDAARKEISIFTILTK
jgi:tetratricopeptide (TPR) repeat protein